MDADPRSLVEAPVRHALAGVMTRGIALVGAVAFLALWQAAAKPEVSVRDGLVMLAVGILVIYSLLVRVLGSVRGRPSPEDRLRAWDRAKEMDSDEAALSLLVAGWVPAGLLLSLVLLVWPHVTDANPALAAAWVVLGIPPIAMAYMVATATWMDACRDDLARAEHESDVVFRTYWSNVGH